MLYDVVLLLLLVLRCTAGLSWLAGAFLVGLLQLGCGFYLAAAAWLWFLLGCCSWAVFRQGCCSWAVVFF
jgi:hypothetical protein